tara:strand:+ start:509 stop:2716 length:2208 start_codon:yes stop_codon:yes gene_type:complete
MALLDFLQRALPSNTAEVDAFHRGAQQFMERRRLGAENQQMNREEQARIERMGIGVQPFDKNAFGADIEVPLYTPPQPLDMDGGISQGQDDITYDELPKAQPIPGAITKENPFPGQITFPEFEQPDLSGMFPEGVTENTDAQAEEKEALHVNGLPWKVVPKGNGQVVVYNGQEFDIKDVFGDGSSLQLVDRNGRPNFPLTDAFTKGRIQGIVNTEINPGDVDTNVPTPQAPTKNKFIDNAVASVKNDRFRNIQSQLTIEQARLVGIPEGEALALLAIESNFGNVPFTGGQAKGALQIEAPAYTDVKQFYAGKMPAGADSAEWQKLKGIAASLPKNFSGLTDNRDQITASLLYLKLIKYKGVDPKFQGAAYNDGYGKFIGINSLRDVKKFAKNHDYNSVNTYNRAFVSLQDYLTQVGNYFYPVSGGQTVTANVPTIGSAQVGTSTTTTGNTGGTANAAASTVPTKLDNKNTVVGVVPQNVTDSVVDKSLKGTTAKQITDPITELGSNPDRLGFEFQRALQARNILAQFAEIDRRNGLTNSDNFKKQILDLQILDTTLYVMQAYDALNKFTYSGNPSRMNAVLDAFTGGALRIRPRTDGLFDFISADGKPVQGMTGLNLQTVSVNARKLFDSKYKASVEAAAAERSKFTFEKNFETNMDMIKKDAELKGFRFEKINDEAYSLFQGNFKQDYTLQTVKEKVPDTGEEVEREVFLPAGPPVQVFNFGVNNYMRAVGIGR